MDRDAPLVYSSHPEKFMKPGPPPSGPGGMPPKGQVLKVRRERQGRAGKTVSTVYEFQASDAQRAFLAKELKQKLGTGGTVKEGIVEIQGDHIEKILALLVEWGYKPKKSGG